MATYPRHLFHVSLLSLLLFPPPGAANNDGDDHGDGEVAAVVDEDDIPDIPLIHTPCDPQNPYRAPYDHRLHELLAASDDSTSYYARCSNGSDWLESFGAGYMSAFTAQHNASLHWGTYRPAQYFAMKTRSAPASMVVGLAWGRGRTDLRHDASQMDDEVRYSWSRHDGRTYASQYLNDTRLDASFIATVVKPRFLGESNIEWMVEVKQIRSSIKSVVPRPGPLSLYFYVGVDCDGLVGDGAPCLSAAGSDGLKSRYLPEGGMLVTGESSIVHSNTMERKPFQLLLKTTAGEEDAGLVSWRCLDHGRVTDVQNDLKAWNANGTGDSEHADGCPLLAIQIEAPDENSLLSVRVAFSEAVQEDDLADFATWESAGRAAFDKKYWKGFSDYPDASKLDPRDTTMRSAVSNLIGGAGYWAGRLQVKGEESTTLETTPLTLYSFTPSRTAFPRGFLWDEGFHLKLVSHFDTGLAAESLARWMTTMRKHRNETCRGGWIPREQALGRDALRRIPPEYRAQDPKVANPPTLLVLASEQILLTESPYYNAEELRNALTPPLRAWYYWLTNSQIADKEAYFKTEAEPVGMNRPPAGLFRWKGREADESRVNPMTLASGFDDFPRSFWPTKHEAHVDLAAWVAASATTLAKIIEAGADSSSLEGQLRDKIAKGYREDAELVKRAIKYYHWDYAAETYTDRGLGLLRRVPKDTVAGGRVISRGVEIINEVVIRCRKENGDTVDSGISADNFAAMQQTMKMRQMAETELLQQSGSRVVLKHMVHFNRSRRIIWEGTPASVAGKGKKDGTVKIRTDTGVVFDAKINDISLVTTEKQPPDFCPPGTTFLYPLGDGEGGLLTRHRAISVEQPRPGMMSDHIGYASFMPLMLKLFDYDGSNGQVEQQMQRMLDKPRGMATPYGVRSLANSSLLYQLPNAPGDRPYWRGYIWVNMNYLLFSSLKHYQREGSAVAAVLAEYVRESMVLAVSKTMHHTKFFWEQYDDGTGRGLRNHPFTGWTALVAAMAHQLE